MKLVAILLLLLVQLQAFTYNPDLSLQFLHYSKVSYCSASKIADWSCESCDFQTNMKDVKVITEKKLGIQSYAAYDADTNRIVVAFRGSSNLKNWNQNLELHRVNYASCHKCKVHAGFLSVYENQASEVYLNVRTLRNKYRSAKVVVTGHSLGGTTAVFAALDLKQRGINVDYLITYGCPRQGNTRFAEYVHAQFPEATRVTHWRDPVPHIPYKIMGFLQIPTEVWYNNPDDAASYQTCVTSGVKEDKQCSASVKDNQVQDHLHYLGMYTGCGDTVTEQNTNVFIKLWSLFTQKMDNTFAQFEKGNANYTDFITRKELFNIMIDVQQSTVKDE